MIELDSSKQLDLFETVKKVLLKSKTISDKFRNDSFYEFEPEVKSQSFPGFPYVVIAVPAFDSKVLTFDNSTNPKDMRCVLDFVMEKHIANTGVMRQVLNAALEILDANEETFKDIGYYDLLTELDPTRPDTIKDKPCVRANLTLKFKTVTGK